MKIGRFLLVFLFLATASACSSLKVGDDFDKTVNFAQFRTFAFAPPRRVDPSSGNKSAPANNIMNRRIQREIQRVLTAKGFTLQPRGDAQLLVAFQVGSKEKTHYSSEPAYPYRHRYGYPYPYWVDPWAVSRTNIRAHTYTEGTLLIDVVEAATNELIWHGWGSETIYPSMDPDQEVPRVVDAILAKFPPT